MNIINKIDSLSLRLQKSNDAYLTNKMGVIKGLYSAYELSESKEIAEKIIEECIELAEHMCDLTINIRECSTNSTKSNYSGELTDFYKYLLECGKTEKTADNYRKNISYVMKKYGIKNVDELKDRIDEMIEIYDGNDQVSHNAHISALKQFRNFIG